MRKAAVALLATGMFFLGFIVYQTDLTEVWSRLREIGWYGFALVLAVYFIAFSFDVATWGLTLPARPPTREWLTGLWKAHAVSDALNRVTPLASLGGEPVKATIMKHRFGVAYRESTAALILTQTTSTVAMVAFLACGFAFLLRMEAVPQAYRLTAGIGLATFSLCIVLYFVAQQTKLFSRTGSWLSARGMGARITTAVAIVHEVEDRLIGFYMHQRRRFVAAWLFAFGNWFMGAVECYLILMLLGHPISFTDAWVIEATVLLVRSALFFVPGDVGTQDGALFFMCGLVTGSPALGLALAVVVRMRELVWIVIGLTLGWLSPFWRPASETQS